MGELISNVLAMELGELIYELNGGAAIINNWRVFLLIMTNMIYGGADLLLLIIIYI